MIFFKTLSRVCLLFLSYFLILNTQVFAAPAVIDLPVDLNDAPDKNYCITNTYRRHDGGVNQCQNGWSFWQHKTDKHINYNGLSGYSPNDTYAWDINLNQPSRNSDIGKNVYAIADGEIYIGYEWGGFSTNPILLEHTDNNGEWSSAYLHMRGLTDKVKQCRDARGARESCLVKKGEYLGQISDKGSLGVHHLHFAVYNSHGKKNMQSIDVSFSGVSSVSQFNSPTPYVSSVSNNALIASSSLHQLSIYGSNFQEYSRVQWRNSSSSNWKDLRRSAEYISSTQLRFKFNDGGVTSAEKWEFRVANGSKYSSPLNVTIYASNNSGSNTCSKHELSYDVNKIIPFEESGFFELPIEVIDQFLRLQGSALYGLDLNNYQLDPPIPEYGNKTFSQYESDRNQWNLDELKDNKPTLNNYSPAKIIYLASKENGLSPIVTLAFLQKEQSLISRKYSGQELQRKLNRAVGYGMYDSGDKKRYYNFLYQLSGLSWQYNKDGKRSAQDFYNFLSGYATSDTDEINLFNVYNQYRKYFIGLGYSPCGDSGQKGATNT